MAETPTPQAGTLIAEQPEVAAPPPGRPTHSLVARLLVALALLALAAAAVLLVSRLEDDGARSDRFVVPALDVVPGADVPLAPAPQARPAPADPALRVWVDRLADATDIPARSLFAYLDAERRTRETTPDCNVTWATLAGIGRVESHHGLYGGARVGDDGRLSKPIVGVPLDGSPGVLAINDTDGGRLDGDTRWDRAVGAMQFLPETWARWGQRATPDGATPDPQDIDDAALTAARYLCARGRDLTTGQGWWSAVLSYNDSTRYARQVFSGADAYARKAAELGTP